MGLDLTERTVRGRRRSRRPVAVMLALIGLPLLAGCAGGPGELSRLGLPEGASTSAPPIHNLWMGAWIAAFVVGFLVWGLILYAAFRFRRRSPDEVPVQVRYNLPIEALYTIAPFVVIFVLFYHTVVAQENVLQEDSEYDHEILVVGQQWSWTFNHLGADGEGGGNDVFEAGTVAEPPTLVLPVDEPVRFRLRSPDVIHSFWIPAYHFKMDVIPGRENSWITTPTETGTFPGKCAELCGLSHARMIFDVKVVERAEYDRYLAELEAQGSTGIATGGSEADEVTGLETESEEGAGE